jgi:6-phosphogluconolactonase/glucosamine-6-phosphate isomerase/deaminase
MASRNNSDVVYWKEFIYQQRWVSGEQPSSLISTHTSHFFFHLSHPSKIIHQTLRSQPDEVEQCKKIQVVGIKT